MTKTAVQKRDEAPPPRVEVVAVTKNAEQPAGRRLIPSPLEVQEVVRRIPTGKVLRMVDLRATLATKFRADYACPTTTKQFLHVVADAAHEERGKAGPPTPYWRVVRDDGRLIDTFPGGRDVQASKLEGEGVDIFRLGQRVVIGNVEHYAWTPPPPKRRGRS